MIQRRTLVPAVLDHDKPSKIELPKDCFIAALQCRLHVELTLAGGSDSGTVLDNDDFNPSQVIRSLQLVTAPKHYKGSPLSLTPSMLYLASHKWQKRAPNRTVLDDGAAEAHTASIEFLLPFARPLGIDKFDMRSLWDARRSIAFLEVGWPATAAALRDLVLSGCDRTASAVAGTQLEVTALCVDPEDAPEPFYQYFLDETVIPHERDGKNSQELEVSAGEGVSCLFFKTRDTSVRSAEILDDEEQQVLYLGDEIHSVEFLKHQRDIFTAIQVADSARPEGAWWVDLGDLDEMPVIGAKKGEGLRVVLNTAIAPTDESNTEVLVEGIVFTAAGRADLARRRAAKS